MQHAVSDIGTGVRSGLVAATWQFLQGPMQELPVGCSPAPAGTAGKRPIHLILDQSQVLERDLSVPIEAKGRMADAAAILVHSQTPFTPEELYVCLTRQRRIADQHVTNLVMVPRSVVADSLAANVTRPSAIGRVSISVSGKRIEVPELAELINPALRWRGFLLALPFALLAMVLATLAQLHNADFQVAAARHEAAISGARSTLATLSDELKRRNDALADLETRSQRRAESLSLPSVLSDLAAAIPEAVEIKRLEGRTGLVRAFVRSPNALSGLDQINMVLSRFSASIEGAIQKDSDGQELATLVLRVMP
jgi:Tfp pilus assembly protein PilN